MDVIISPDRGKAQELGRQLLELADHPSQVQWATWPQMGFRVPVELAAKLKNLRDGQVTEAEVEQWPDAAPKRRGRPRKQAVEATDDTEKEE